MITPDKVKPRGTDDEQELKSFERVCDDAIATADATDTWPAPVKQLRQRIKSRVVEAAAAKYEAAGWTVAKWVANDVYLTIDRPVVDLRDAAKEAHIADLKILDGRAGINVWQGPTPSITVSMDTSRTFTRAQAEALARVIAYRAAEVKS